MKIPKNGFTIPEIIIPKELLYDVTNFHKVNNQLNAYEASQAFLTKWPGYKASYSLEFVVSVFKITME
jgi:hypothetical protein